MSWNLEDFYKECTQRGITDVYPFLKTLSLKEHRANYLAKKSLTVWDDLFSQSTVITYGDETWNETELLSEAYTEAALLYTQSMSDIVAQVVRICMNINSLTIDNVSLDTVIKKLTKNNSLSQPEANVLQALNNLKSSDEFKYVNAFMNMSKHRYLVDTEHHTEFGVGTRNDIGLRFKEFEYKAAIFPITWQADIVRDYIPTCINLICDIGNTLTDYLKHS